MARKSDAQKSAEAEVGVFQRSLGPFVVAGELTRMPIVFTNARDPACPIIFANDSLLSLTGHDRAELLGESIFSLLAQDADAGVLASIKKGFQRGSSIEREVKCRRRDGTDFWATLFASPVLDPQGKIIRRFKFEVQLPVTC